MKIVGVAACTAGIAHTYMAREKLIKGAKARGHECVVETQGTIGTEHKLTSEQIAEADVLFLRYMLLLLRSSFTAPPFC
jgi:PTS system fructose-specific IIB component